MTITFNIIIYTHIIPRDRLSIGCLAAISHLPLIGYHPHFFTLRYVTLRWFAGRNRPSCEISFLSFSECLSQGEILWYCHRHNVLRLKQGEKWENEIKWILSYSLSNNISLCRDLNYCVRFDCGVTVSRPYHPSTMRGMKYFWGNSDWQAPRESKLLEYNDLLWIMQGRLSGAVCSLSVLLGQTVMTWH